MAKTRIGLDRQRALNVIDDDRLVCPREAGDRRPAPTKRRGTRVRMTFGLDSPGVLS